MAPFVWINLLAFDMAGAGLGPDPIEETQDFMGEWALRMLLLTLALTPLRRLTGWLWLIQLRRMSGLYALMYASMHVLNYLIPDQGLAWGAIIEDIIERPFITAGAGALVILLILGITSTSGWQRRLGKRWQVLHRFVYPATLLVLLHFWWQIKSVADITEPLLYALIVTLLFVGRTNLIKRSHQRPQD